MMSIRSSRCTGATEEHDEGYFASFTDLLIGILFIFIIMLVISASNYQTKQRETEDAAEIPAKINEARNQTLNKMEDALKSVGVKVVIDHKHGVLRLPESLLFESGRWEPNADGNVALSKLANVLLTYLPCLSSSNDSDKTNCGTITFDQSVLEAVLIEGHTDMTPFRMQKGFDTNLGLSAKLSITIYERLIQNKGELTNITNADGFPVLGGVSGYAASRPISEIKDENRRIDIRFIMRSPTPEEIQKIKNAMDEG